MRYITPEKCIQSRLDGRSPPAWESALLVFRDFPSSKVVLDAFAPVTPIRYRMLYNITSAEFEPFVFEAEAGGRSIAIVTRCVWGGPQTAILVEELAALGIRTIVGYGVAGSLGSDLAQGSFIVAKSALPTDGTTKSYRANTLEHADPELLHATYVAGQKVGCTLWPVTAATIDALYRETTELVEELRGLGADIVQMECSPLYAVSRVCDVRSIWLGYVTDCLGKGTWYDWYRPLPDANEKAIRICREIFEML